VIFDRVACGPPRVDQPLSVGVCHRSVLRRLSAVIVGRLPLRHRPSQARRLVQMTFVILLSEVARPKMGA
jgi:hypothetical protein